MPLTASARSVAGSLRQEIEVDGRHRLSTDEPLTVGGEGSAPSPHELLPAALAACISTQLVMYARTKEWELGGVTVHVTYDHRATPRSFEIDIELGAPVTQPRVERLRKVATGCPVRRALEGGAVFVERFSVRGEQRAA